MKMDKYLLFEYTNCYDNGVKGGWNDILFTFNNFDEFLEKIKNHDVWEVEFDYQVVNLVNGTSDIFDEEGYRDNLDKLLGVNMSDEESDLQYDLIKHKYLAKCIQNFIMDSDEI